jgi:hypothetical protein
VDLNGAPFGRAETRVDMTFDFGTLIAHLAKTRKTSAQARSSARAPSPTAARTAAPALVDRGGRGYSCLAEVRTVETIGRKARPRPSSSRATPSASGWRTRAHTIFGAIDRSWSRPNPMCFQNRRRPAPSFCTLSSCALSNLRCPCLGRPEMPMVSATFCDLSRKASGGRRLPASARRSIPPT